MDLASIQSIALSIKAQNPTYGSTKVGRELARMGIIVDHQRLHNLLYRKTAARPKATNPKPPMRPDVSSDLNRDRRATMILDAIEDGAATVDEIAERVTTEHRITLRLIAQLEDYGIIYRDAAGNYQLARTVRRGRPIGHELRI